MFSDSSCSSCSLTCSKLELVPERARFLVSEEVQGGDAWEDGGVVDGPLPKEVPVTDEVPDKVES